MISAASRSFSPSVDTVSTTEALELLRVGADGKEVTWAWDLLLMAAKCLCLALSGLVDNLPGH